MKTVCLKYSQTHASVQLWRLFDAKLFDDLEAVEANVDRLYNIIFNI